MDRQTLLVGEDGPWQGCGFQVPRAPTPHFLRHGGTGVGAFGGSVPTEPGEMREEP